MGYYTNLKLGVELPDDLDVDSLIQAVTQIDREFMGYVEQLLEGADVYLKSSEWTSEGVTLLSQLFPERTFYLYGIGEKPGDMWISKHENGQVYIRELAKEWTLLPRVGPSLPPEQSVPDTSPTKPASIDAVKPPDHTASSCEQR
jgi:hypothetical protein